MNAKDKIDFLAFIKEKDEKGIQLIYDSFFGKVASLISKNNGSYNDAKEIFDKVIYQIYARLMREDFTIQSSFEAFIVTACKNLWRRELNKRSRRWVTSGQVKELYYQEKEHTQSLLEQERWELFHEKMNEISEQCKKILSLFFDKISSKEIMHRMGYATENTARQRVFKCKKQLMKLVQIDQRYLELKNI